MTKIVIVQAPALDQSKHRKKLLLSPCSGTGIKYISQYLKKNGYDCKSIDFYFDNWDFVKKTLKKEDPEIIGITCLTEGRYNAYKMISVARSIKKEAKIVLGGHHSTHMYDQILSNFDADYVVLGEGEEKFLNLVKHLEEKTPISLLDGIAYKENGKIIANNSKEKTYIENLNDLPFPFTRENIHAMRKYPSLKELKPRKLKYLSQKEGNYKYITIITSRGCVYDCSFCSSTRFWGKKWRFRSPENVVKEIEMYYKNFSFRYFNIADDAFTIIPKRAIEICKGIVEKNLKIRFDCTTRADKITEELTFWLEKSGCLFVALGIESGSQKILETINKKIKLKSVVNAFSILKKHGLIPYPLLMVGNPNESKKTINETISLLKLLKPKFVSISKTMVFPNTQLYEHSKQQGFIDDSYWLTSKPPPYYTFERPEKKLDNWVFRLQNFNIPRYKYVAKSIVRTGSNFSEKLPNKLKTLIGEVIRRFPL